MFEDRANGYKIAYRTALNAAQKADDYSLILQVAIEAQKKYYDVVKDMIFPVDIK